MSFSKYDHQLRQPFLDLVFINESISFCILYSSFVFVWHWQKPTQYHTKQSSMEFIALIEINKIEVFTEFQWNHTAIVMHICHWLIITLFKEAVLLCLRRLCMIVMVLYCSVFYVFFMIKSDTEFQLNLLINNAHCL